MLFLAVKMAYDEYNKQKEGFTSTEQKVKVISKLVALIVGIIIALLLPVWAVGTSWYCSTVLGKSFPAKLWYGFWAQVFAPLYILLRAIFPKWCPTSLI